MPQPKHTAIPSDPDPANSKPPTPADKNPTLPDPKAQQPGQSADNTPVSPDPKAQQPGQSADNIPVSPDPKVQQPGQSADNTPVSPDPKAQQPGNSADPPQTPPKIVEPNLPDPTSQGKETPPTTIQLRPQPNEKPTTIFIGGTTDGKKSTSGIGALIFNAFGKVDPTAKSDGASDPEASTADPAAPFSTVEAAGQHITISDPSAVSIAGTVLTPGGAEATIAGTPVSLAPSGNLVVGTGPPHQVPSILTIAGHTITANPTSFDIAGTPIKAGAPAVTVSGTAISMGASGDLVIGAGASTTSPPAAAAAVFTVGAQRFTAEGSTLVGSGTTIRPGGPAALVAGTTVSLDPSGVLTVGDVTTTLPGLSQPSAYTVGGETFTPNPTGFPVAGATLSPGGPGVTVNHTLISLNPSGSLLLGSSTIALPGASTPAVVSTDGQVLTVEPNGLVAVDGVTLSSGGPGVTVSGTPMSVGAGGFAIGSDVVRLPGVNGSASGSVVQFRGSAAQAARLSRLVLWGSLGLMAAVGMQLLG